MVRGERCPGQGSEVDEVFVDSDLQHAAYLIPRLIVLIAIDATCPESAKAHFSGRFGDKLVRHFAATIACEILIDLVCRTSVTTMHKRRIETVTPRASPGLSRQPLIRSFSSRSGVD